MSALQKSQALTYSSLVYQFAVIMQSLTVLNETAYLFGYSPDIANDDVHQSHLFLPISTNFSTHALAENICVRRRGIYVMVLSCDDHSTINFINPSAWRDMAFAYGATGSIIT